MQYILLIYENEAQWEGKEGGEALEKVIGEHGALVQSIGASFKGGAGLKPTTTATTVRLTPGGEPAIHDGPFAETKEQLGGYYVIDVPSLDEAIAIARKVPAPFGGSIEIRPLLNEDDGGGA